jgi:hypothetical protein
MNAETDTVCLKMISLFLDTEPRSAATLNEVHVLE